MSELKYMCTVDSSSIDGISQHQQVFVTKISESEVKMKYKDIEFRGVLHNLPPEDAEKYLFKTDSGKVELTLGR